MRPRALSLLIGFLGAIQITAYAVWLFSDAVKVNKQVSCYIVFITILFGLYALAFPRVKQYCLDSQTARKLKVFLVIEAVLTFLLLSALFKLIIYDRWPQVAQHAYYTLLVLLLLHKIFHKFIFEFWDAFLKFINLPFNAVRLSALAFYGFIPIIVFLIYLPDVQGIVARVFIAEQFHNWDIAVMGPAYAYSKGNLINVDVGSHYGLGMPMVAAWVMKLMGGITYEHLLTMLMWLCIGYYTAWFLLLRKWLGGVLIPIAVILFAIRTQMFHIGAYPLTFTYPSGTPLRFFMDVVVFVLLWRFLKTQQSWLLWICGFCCGFMIFYMFAEGLYLTMAFYAFLFLQFTHSRTRASLYREHSDAWRLIGFVLCVPIVALGCMLLTQREQFFLPVFWKNMAGYGEVFFNGLFIGPMYGSLIQRNFLESLMGLVMPLVYVATIVVGGGMWYTGLGSKKHVLAVVIAVQGLGLYHYYTMLSIWTGYYMLGVPYNVLIGFWLNEIIQQSFPQKKTVIGLSLVAICLWALLTNFNFISYPNVMNFSRNPLIDSSVVQAPPGRVSYFNHLFREYPDAFKLPQNSLGQSDEDLKMENDFLTDEALKAYYLQEINFQLDAALIQKFTRPQDGVPLIASFEIEFLRQADRKPFFYHFPLLNSRPLRMRMFHVSLLNTYSELKKTVGQLESTEPPYVFMERIYLNTRVPDTYYYDTPGLMGVLAYIHEHYEPVEVGEYLVAMKRKQ